MNTPIQNVSYTYDLPHELLATEPVTPRDHSRLFIYNTSTDQITFDHFYNLHKYLSPNSLMVLNETTVAPSRITLYKATGGKVVCLFLLNERMDKSGEVRIMVDRRVQEGVVLFDLADGEREPVVTIIQHSSASIFIGKLTISKGKLLLLLDREGDMPIPLYLRKTVLGKDELKEKYQTTFAKRSDDLVSVAAPTASLHFTPKVFRNLDTKNIQRAHVRLEVGLGTFAPLSLDQVRSGTLHTEWYLVPEDTRKKVKEARTLGKKIVAVGTTAVRTLESYALSQSSVGTHRKDSEYLATNIFIRPGHVFHHIDNLITNFHLPDSSLMMLVEALLQSKDAKRPLIELYRIAVLEKFRFYSFGDAMLII